jgi:hypothetical protein
VPPTVANVLKGDAVHPSEVHAPGRTSSCILGVAAVRLANAAQRNNGVRVVATNIPNCQAAFPASTGNTSGGAAHNNAGSIRADC